MFHIGQRVECIDDTPPGRGYLQKGRIYIVISLTGRNNAPGYVLIENGGGHANGGWLPHRFRPIVERKTDISVFTEMLKPKEVEKA